MKDIELPSLPEPVAFRWRVPIVDSVGRQCGESDWKFGAEKGSHPWWTRDSLITTTQAEAYADERVRDARLEILEILETNWFPSQAAIEERIRSLISKEES